MRMLRRFLRRLTAQATTRQDEARLQAEIEEHLAFQIAENLRDGLSPVEARRRAFLKFGSVGDVKESYRDERGIPFMETLIHDIRHVVRRLRMAPAFSAAAILTLALGIGATTSIFTLVYAVLLKSLAVANPDELYRLGKEARFAEPGDPLPARARPPGRRCCRLDSRLSYHPRRDFSRSLFTGSRIRIWI